MLRSYVELDILETRQAQASDGKTFWTGAAKLFTEKLPNSKLAT